MSRRVSRRGVAVGAAVVVVAIIAAVLITGAPESQTTSSGEPLNAQDTDSVRSAESTPASETAAATSPLVATTESGELIPPKSKPKTSGSTATPSAPGTQPTPSTPEEAAYLEETKKVVETNASELAAVAEAVTEALSDGDEGDLSTLLAGDEGDQSEYVETMTTAYPPMESTQLGSNVNVFASGETTLYIAYAIVTWTDAGITSEHTIPIVLRFIDGEWRLSTLGEDGSDLEFVQSVAL